MIEVICYPSGDSAEAEDPEAAIVAAKTLCADDAADKPFLGRERHVDFYVDGKLVRSARERDLWVALREETA